MVFRISVKDLMKFLLLVLGLFLAAWNIRAQEVHHLNTLEPIAKTMIS